MHKAYRLLAFWKLALIGALLLTACGEMQLPRDRPTKAVAISDFRAVAGKWSGLLHREPEQSDDDFLELTISENGRFRFALPRTIGLFSGGGSLAIKGGKLVRKTNDGSVTLTLYEERGNRMLAVDARETTGKKLRWNANLFPAK